MLTYRSRIYVAPTLLFLGVAFAAANGLAYGIGNLRQYLLHGLHAIDSNFLAADWFTAHTQAHHSAFNFLIVLMSKLASLDVGFIAANGVCGLAFVVCIYFLAALVHRTPLLVASVTAFLLIFIPGPYIGWTSIINLYFQPSTIGAVGLMAALTCLCHKRYKIAGIVLLVACVFHINYTVWAIVIVGSVLLLNLRSAGVRRASFVLVPLALAALYHLPFFWASRTPEQLACADLASYVLHDVYMPCHSRPLTWGAEPFIRFGVLLTAGAVAYWMAPLRRGPGKMAQSILLVISIIVVVGGLLTTLIQIDFIALIFPFRLAPFLIVASVITIAGAFIATTFGNRFSPLRSVCCLLILGGLLHRAGVNAYGLTWLAAIAGALVSRRVVGNRLLPASRGLLVCLAVHAVLLLMGAGKIQIGLVTVCWAGSAFWRVFVEAGRSDLSAANALVGWVRRLRSEPTPLRRMPGLAAALVPFCIAALLLKIGGERKDLGGPPPPLQERQLYNWCQGNTNSRDVFIIPPVLGSFRLEAQRAVVADWKCMPILPADTVEWYSRLSQECGGGFASFGQLRDGYDAMPAERAEAIASRYGARYLIVYRDRHKIDPNRFDRVFENDAFLVFDLDGAETPQPHLVVAD